MSVPTPVRTLFRTASVLAFIAVFMGAVVCATDSGFECGNWPGCTDHTLLPAQGTVSAMLYKNPWIEMIHRTSAILAGPAALIVAIVALRLKNVRACVKFLPWLAVVGAVVAGVVGRGIVLGQVFPTWIGAADLLFANACMIALIVATVALERGPGGFSPTRSGIAAWTATGLLLAAHTVALWTAATGSYTRCMSWPVWTAVEGDDPVLTVVRYALYLGAVVAIGLAVRGTIAHDRTVALTVAGLLVALLVLGPIIGFGQIAWLGFAYSILTVSIIAALVLLAARESLPAHQQDDNPLHPAVDPVGAGRP